MKSAMHPVLAMQVSYCSGHAGLISGVPSFRAKDLIISSALA
eukprot:COSAG01_NODE_145_length_24103_cov_41.178012_32_plen_42_part_00